MLGKFHRATTAHLLAGGARSFARTLLLVAGDHGQGLRGDHGGSSAEETDTVLLAFDIGR